MRQTLAKSLAVALAGAALLALVPTAPARADSAGPAVAAGLGGFALGAMLGATARPAPPVYYAPPPPPPVYVEEPPRRYAPVREHCWFERHRVYDEYGAFAGYQRERVCE